MIPPEPRLVAMIGTIVQQHPEVLAWVETWYYRELETLPVVINHPAVQQGRCQVLGELYQFLKRM